MSRTSFYYTPIVIPSSLYLFLSLTLILPSSSTTIVVYTFVIVYISVDILCMIACTICCTLYACVCVHNDVMRVYHLLHPFTYHQYTGCYSTGSSIPSCGHSVHIVYLVCVNFYLYVILTCTICITIVHVIITCQRDTHDVHYLL